MKALPPLLAPLLFDSPCNLTERNKTGQKNGPLKLSMLDKYSVTAYNQVIKANITPFVSQLTPDDVNEYIEELIKTHTDYKHLIEDELFKTNDLGKWVKHDFCPNVRIWIVQIEFVRISILRIPIVRI